jgi:hypothetical protein
MQPRAQGTSPDAKGGATATRTNGNVCVVIMIKTEKIHASLAEEVLFRIDEPVHYASTKATQDHRRMTFFQ